MAPYAGPSIVELVAMFRKPKLEYTPALGFGLPRAPLQSTKDGFELRRMSGGEGFGVQPDLVSPFVDEGVIVATRTWQEMIAWLCEHWESDWGAAFKSRERLVVTFVARGVKEEIVCDRLESASAACRAARAAGGAIDFDVTSRGARV